LVARTKARYEQMQALKAQGKGIKPIMRELELATETVRKFYSVDELLAKPRGGRPSVLDAYKAYLHERWNTGCTNASTLHREITEQGYTLKSITTVLTATPRPPGPWIAPALMET
jgi:transposase